MADNERLPLEEEVIEEVATPGEEMVEEVTETPPEEEVAEVGTAPMIHTVEEIPELAGRAVGDTITFRIDNVTDDGNTFELSVAPEPEELETPGPEAMGEGTGREEIRDMLLS